MKTHLFALLLFISAQLSGQKQAIHWIDFDSSNVTDNIGALNGTIFGAVSDTGRNNYPSGALSFDGVDDRVFFGQDDPGKDSLDLSICIWYYPKTAVVPSDTNQSPSVTTNQYLFSTGSETGDIGFAMIWSKGRVQCLRKTSTTSTNSGRVGYADNTWHHQCMTYNNGNKVLSTYLDSMLISTDTGVAGSFTNVHADVSVGKAGNNINNNRNHFFGLIDDIKIYDAVLSSKEIRDLYIGDSMKTDTTMKDTLSVSPFYDTKKVDLFPNPAGNSVNVVFNSSENATLSIYSINGAKVSEKVVLNEEKIELPISDLERGTYILEVTFENGQRDQQRFVKQ